VSLLLQYGLLPCLILTTAFGATDKKSFFYRLLTFYAIGFFLGGALLFLKQERSSLKRLLTFGIGAAGMVWLILPMFLRRQIEKKQEYEVVVSLGEKRICGTALLDTGNRLREPISGKPVILADFQTVKPGLSKEALEALENREGFEGDLDRLIESFGGKLRIIPYHAVGTRSGILYGLEVKELKIWARGRWITKEDVMLGLVFEPLAAWGEYQFILHEDFMSG
jgi:stage II sporulation protein GA (sporulation sigma-E factor processing peptidase)